MTGEKTVAGVLPAFDEEGRIAQTVTAMPALVDRLYVVDGASQAGVAAISLRMLEQLDLDRIYAGYGFPNDLLVHLNVINARVRDIPSRPIYGVGERSGIRIRKVVPRISWLLVKGFFWRMKEKYVIRDFHPLVFFYALGFLMTGIGLALGIAETILRFLGNPIPSATVVLVA